jgi:hypothetical protein
MLHSAARRRPRRTRTGRVPLPRSDGRTVTSRRFRDLVTSYSAELGGELTEAERGLIQQAAAIQIRCEQAQLDIVEGRTVDPDMMIRLSSENRRLLACLGARADKSRPAGPALYDYLADKYPARPAEESEDEA